MEKFQQEKEKGILEFKEQFEIFKKLRKERKHLQNNLVEERCNLKKNVGNGVNYRDALVVTNVGSDTFFKDTMKLNMDVITIR